MNKRIKNLQLKYSALLIASSLLIASLLVVAQPNAALSSPTKNSLSPEEVNNIRVWDKAHKAVVNLAISTNPDPQAYFFGGGTSNGIGSGTVISEDGYIVTSDHVVSQADNIRATLHDGTSFDAKIIGRDPSSDLAVIKLMAPKGTKFKFLKLSDASTDLQVGRRVLAIGSPYGFDQSMTQGMVSSINRAMKSSTGRMVKGVIQTDASINQGNSGGPLLDTSGDLVGINTAIFSPQRGGGSVGIGLAIPSAVASRVVPQLIQFHKVMRPELGITAKPHDGGLRVIQVDPNGPSHDAGIQGPKIVNYQDGALVYRIFDASLADLITHVDDVKVQTEDDLYSYIEKKQPNQVVKLTVVRGGKVLKIPVKLVVTKTG